MYENWCHQLSSSTILKGCSSIVLKVVLASALIPKLIALIFSLKNAKNLYNAFL